MTIDVERQDGAVVLRVKGQISTASAEFLETAVEALDSSATGMVVDLSQVRMITSAGLGDLVRLIAQANTHEQRVILAAPAPYVEGILQTTKLDKFFEVRPTVDDALALLG